MSGNVRHSIAEIILHNKSVKWKDEKMMMLELVERRFPSLWKSLKTVWYHPHYVEVALKVVSIVQRMLPL